MITKPRKSIGITQTEVGPAHLLHCYKHRDNVAIALLVLPLRRPKWEYMSVLDIELFPDVDPQYLSPIIDEARGYRMVSSMGLCRECVKDAMDSGFDWLRLTFIIQEVTNWAENTTQKFGAFGGNTSLLDFYRVHTVNSDVNWEISFVGQMQSVIRIICPTCLRDANLSGSRYKYFRQHLLYGAEDIHGVHFRAEPSTNI